LDASEHISLEIFGHRQVAFCQAIDDLTELFRVLSCEFDTNVCELDAPSLILAQFPHKERALLGGTANFGAWKELGQNI
jgi:hypothetical protein